MCLPFLNLFVRYDALSCGWCVAYIAYMGVHCYGDLVNFSHMILRVDFDLLTNFVALVRERTVPTERPPLVGEVSANICGLRGVAWSVRRIPYGRNLGLYTGLY
jgi:hypothetical protein